MKIKTNGTHGQVCLAAFFILMILSCNLKKEEIPILPPVTSPLSRQYIGYGVVNVSYTRVTGEPEENSDSPGHLRRGSVVRIHQRRLVKHGDKAETWVLVEGSCRGWLRETLLDIYDNEMQAQTASESMSK